MVRMKGVGSCTLLLLSLSLTLLFRVAWSHPFGIPRQPMLGPYPPYSWAGYPIDQHPYNYYFLMHKRAGSDVKAHPKASSADARDVQPDSMERTTPMTLPGKPQAAEEDQQRRLKRPLDTVGSGFMKKARDEGKDSSKRQLDHVGIGLMKRPVDAPWPGPFKMMLHHSDANTIPAQSNDLDNGWSSKLGERITSSVEAIKEGLVILADYLIKGDNPSNHIVLSLEVLEIMRAEETISDGLGDGSSKKEIDLEMVRRGVDYFARALSLLGQDIGGFQSIKAALGILDRRMRKPSSSKISDNDGLAMLKKGLDQLATTLVKNGADVDNVNLIVREAINLASWMSKYKPNKNIPPATKDLDEKPELEKNNDDDDDSDVSKKDNDDADSGVSKKALDKLGSGFIKKGLDHVGSNLMKRFEDTDEDAEDQLLHDFGSEIITSGYENIAKDPHNAKFKTFVEELKKKALDKTYAELRRSAEKEKPNNSIAKTAQKVTKDMKSENIVKTQTKKSLDELGSGLMKKDLDYLGSGLIKKDVDYPEQQELFKKLSPRPDTQIKGDMKSDWSSESGEGRTSAIEMIKKGLDVLGAGLFKRDRKGFPEIKTALHQLSMGLGDGSVDKDVDVEVMKRGLDHLGAEFLKRGLDTQGLYYIKRGLDTLRRRMTEPVSSKSSFNDGLGLLKKGLDNLALSLEMHGVDIDGLNLIVKGTVSLVNLMAKHPSDDHIPPAAGVLDKKPELEKIDDDDADSEFSKKVDEDADSDFSKKDDDDADSNFSKKADDDDDSDFSKKDDDDADSDVSKKALDKLGSGFIKKGLDHVGSNLMKRFEDVDGDMKEKYLDDFGSGFIINEYDNAAKHPDNEKVNEQLTKEAVNKKYAEFMLSLETNKPEDNKAKIVQNFPNDVKLGVNDAKKPVPKKSLDKLGSGLMKKDLDYLGSGLFKKDFHDPDSKALNQNRV